ncbi:hypothetical protein EDD85DRAFT_343378 [Armillaria nabsnona]|nr:hypothetical protein EDD85DRAFT_343378 [Armillaria nabsnona]
MHSRHRQYTALSLSMVLPSRVAPVGPEHLWSAWTRCSRACRLCSDSHQSLSCESMCCVCPEAQLFEHVPAENSYRLPEPWTVLDRFNPDSNSPAPSAASNSYPNDADISSSPRTASSYYNTDLLSHDGRNISLTPAPISSPSPSPGSTSSAIQHDTVETQVYTSRGYLPQYSNRFVRSPEADPQDGLAANGNFQYQYHGNIMYHGYPEGWSDPYGPGSMQEAS